MLSVLCIDSSSLVNVSHENSVSFFFKKCSLKRSISCNRDNSVQRAIIMEIRVFYGKTMFQTCVYAEFCIINIVA